QWDGTGAHYLDSGNSAAYALNDAGHVVGLSNYRPAMWSGGTLTYLDGLGGACGWGSYITPGAINNSAQIGGTDQSEDGNFAWMLSIGGLGPAASAPPTPKPEAVRALGLTVFGANPVRGVISLRCALPQLGPATLDLIDVSGRRVATRA